MANEEVAYGEHEDQVFDLFLSNGPTPRRPLALILHGGFWRAPFTRRSTRALAAALAERDWPVANVEYRRLGAGCYRAMLDDIAAARARLGDFERVVAIGHSAGGQLALWLAAEGSVDVALTLGGVCDLADAAVASLGDRAVVEFLGGSPADVPDAYGEADPAARLPLGRPHVVLHGLRDDRVPVDHARRYAQRAREAGDRCRLVEIDADHFMPIDPRSAAWPAVVDALNWLTGEL